MNGVDLYYEVAGEGFPLVWSHELGGASESWDAQVRFFSRYYQVITYNDRGYPPSGVPTDPSAYSQEQSVEDLYRLLQHLGMKQAYVGGLSMGGGLALSFGLAYPDMAKGLIVAGAGTGATDPKRFSKECNAFADRLDNEGIEGWARDYADGPTRRQLKRKDPKGWERFRDGLLAHSALGTALTLRGVQGKRTSILALEQELLQLQVPTLIVVGDEDDPCLEPALFMKRRIPRSGIVVLPQSGHTVNLEEPELFNKAVLDFLVAIEDNRWQGRDEGSGVGFLTDAHQ